MKMTGMTAVLFFIGTAFGQAPDWYTTHKHRGYQPEFYLVGVGTADGANAVEKAKRNAQADIVSQIRVQVKGEIRTITESFQLDQNESISSDFRSQARTVVNEEITGAAIVETFVDPATQTAYALAALERDRYCEGLRDEMNTAWHEASALRTSADEMLTRGNFADAVHAVADARSLLVAALPKKALHDAVAGKSFTPPTAASPVSYTGEMKTMISMLHIEKLSGDKQDGTVGKSFGAPFTVRVFYGTVPVAGATVHFAAADDAVLADALTDEKGEASFQSRVRMLPGNTLRAQVSLAGLSKEFDGNLRSTAAVFSYSPAPSHETFEIVTRGLAGHTADALKGKVAAAVTTTGYAVHPSSTHLLVLSMQHAPASKNEGFSGTLYTVKVEAIIALSDKATGAEAGQYTVSCTGGGRSEDEAVAKAVTGIVIDRLKLADLLEKIQQ